MVFLDSDVLVDVFRQHPPALAWLASLGAEPIALSGFVAMELIQGCRNKAQQTETLKDLRRFAILWPPPEGCDEALRVFAQYRLSHGLGLLDALVAQQSVSLNLPLYTFNEKHYACVPGIRLAQPYVR